jgi:hypothetical protein
MVLHVLSCPGTSLFIPQVPQTLNKLENNLLISDDEIYTIVRHALNITNDAFLEYLTKPGFDGVPFIEETELQQLARYSKSIKWKNFKILFFNNFKHKNNYEQIFDKKPF